MVLYQSPLLRMTTALKTCRSLYLAVWDLNYAPFSYRFNITLSVCNSNPVFLLIFLVKKYKADLIELHCA